MTLAAMFVALLLSSGRLLQSQAPAGPHRPPQVPEDFVVTPFGYFHPSCIVHLDKGDTLMQGGRVIQKAGGTSLTPACEYPHYTARGEKLTADSKIKPPTISHSWIVSEGTTTTTSYGELIADWYVPSAPFSNDGQTLYFFPGLQDDSDTVSILQPVLGWNADFSNAWGIASWNCCIAGTADESSPVSVHTGDLIAGSIQSTCASGTVSCPTWNVTTQDGNTGVSTTLTDTPADGQTFNWAFAGAVEVYNLAQCSDYPPNDYITFSPALFDDNFNDIASPSWSFTNWASGLTPQCDYSGEVNSIGQATLGFGNYGGPPWSFSAGIPSTNACHGPGSFSFTLNQEYNANSLQWIAANTTSNTEILNFSWTMSDTEGVIAEGQASGSTTATRAPIGTPSIVVNGAVLQTLTGCDAQFSETVTGSN